MSYPKYIVLLFSVFIIVQQAANGQLTIKASVDKNRILLGEPFQLTVEAIMGSNVKKFNLPDSIPHFEFLAPLVIDSISKYQGIELKAVYMLTSFDSGRWNLPSFSLSANIKTDSIPIDVVFSDFDPQQDYHDIKDIIEIKPAKKKTQWWWIIAGAILLGLILYAILQKKNKPIPVLFTSSLSPYDEAIRELNELKKKELPAKQFHSGITTIFRIYIFRRKEILSLQKTTADLVVKLRELDLSKTDFEKLAKALRLSDFVKFAKYEPSEEDDEETWLSIRDTIERIENKA